MQHLEPAVFRKALNNGTQAVPPQPWYRTFLSTEEEEEAHCRPPAEEGARKLAGDLVVHRESEQVDRSPAKVAAGHNPAETAGRNLAGKAVHTLDARKSVIHSPVEVAAARRTVVEAGHSCRKKDKEAAHTDWELRTILRLAHHTIEPQAVETPTRPYYRKKGQ